MADYDLSDPFSDTQVGIMVGALLLQGGAEEVTRQMAKELNAPIYTLYYDQQRFDEDFREDVRTRVRRIGSDDLMELEMRPDDAFDEGFLPQTPGGGYSLSDSTNVVDEEAIEADLLICADTRGAIMANQMSKDIPYITYLHHAAKSYTDYFWDIFDRKEGWKDKLGWAKTSIIGNRRAKKAVLGSERLMANSQRTKHFTMKAWGADSDMIDVVYPPVDTKHYTPGQADPPVDLDRYFLSPQRLEPYKNIHTQVEAAKQAEEHLVFTGTGSLEEYARREAQYSDYIHLLGYMPEETLLHLYRGAEATLQGALREDFGIVPPESMACGTPCIVPGSGGFLETVGNGFEEDPDLPYETEYGVLLDPDEFLPRTLGGAMQNFKKDDYDSDVIRDHAEIYGADKFSEQINDIAEDVLRERDV